MSFDSGFTTLTIANPGNAAVGNYTIGVTCTNNHPDTANNTLTFVVQITQNYGCSVASNFTNQSFPAHKNTTVNTSGIAHFTDTEGDSISLVSYTITPANSFLTMAANMSSVTVSNPGNADVGNYTVSMVCQDQYSDTGTGQMNFTIEIYENLACYVLNQFPDKTFVAHTNTTVDTSSAGTTFSDYESEAISRVALTITPTPANNVIQYNTSSNYFNITIQNPLNSDVGNYTVDVT